MRKVIRGMWALLCAQWFMAVAPVAAAELEELDRYARSALEDWQVPGLALAIVRDDQLIHAKGFGVRQRGQPAQVDEHTLFYIGSTTKAFTATALGVLVDEGRLRWNDPVIEHLPWFRLSDPWLTQQVTVADVLSHRSGLAGNGTTGGNPWVFLPLNARQTVQRLRFAPLPGAFRQQFLYSNLGYATAGQVLAEMSGLTWRQFVQQRLLTPLRMNESGTSPEQFWDAGQLARCYACDISGDVDMSRARVANIAMPHERDVLLPWRKVEEASGSIVSNAVDMANWLRFNLNGGTFSGKQIVSERILRTLHAPQVLVPESMPWSLPDVSAGSVAAGGMATYGLGWYSSVYRGHAVLYHGGGVPGMPAYIVLLPQKKIGLVVLANGRGVGPSYAIHQDIVFHALDTLLGLSAKDWRKQLLTPHLQSAQRRSDNEQRLQRARIGDATPSLPLANYAGDYEEGQIGSLGVALRDARLVLEVPDGFSATLEHWHAETFRVHGGRGFDPVFMTFHIDERARVTGAWIDGIGELRRKPAMQ